MAAGASAALRAGAYGAAPRPRRQSRQIEIHLSADTAPAPACAETAKRNWDWGWEQQSWLLLGEHKGRNYFPLPTLIGA